MSDLLQTDGERQVYEFVVNRIPCDLSTVYGKCGLDLWDAVKIVRSLIERDVFVLSGATVTIEQLVRKMEEPKPTAPAKQETKPEPEPATARFRIRKAHYRPLKGLSVDRTKQLAARICDWMAHNGESADDGTLEAPARDLERGLHASRYPQWPDALSSLTKRGVFSMADGRVRLQPDADFGDPYPIEPEPRKPRSKRPLSEWVKNKIRERGGTIPDEW